VDPLPITSENLLSEELNSIATSCWMAGEFVSAISCEAFGTFGNNAA
jgi:hypothetical protein